MKNNWKNKCKQFEFDLQWLTRYVWHFRTGLKFAYQDLSKQREEEEAKLKKSNPQKAEQMERLGMGFGNRR